MSFLYDGASHDRTREQNKGAGFSGTNPDPARNRQPHWKNALERTPRLMPFSRLHLSPSRLAPLRSTTSTESLQLIVVRQRYNLSIHYLSELRHRHTADPKERF